MLRRFPGRTLEEIDAMDWTRYMRAMAAERVMQAEDRRAAWLGGAIKTMNESDWVTVAENDALLLEDE